MSRVLLAIAMLAAMASADPAPPATTDAGEPAARLERRHAIYVDLLGRAGLWGIGYDVRPRRWFAIGAAASYYAFDGDRFTTLAPYAALYPLVRGPHAAFVQLGPDLVRRTTPSPVPEWNGMTTTRSGAELCARPVAQLHPAVIDAADDVLVAGDFNTNWLTWAGGVPVLAADRDQAPIVDSYMTSLGFDLPSAGSGPTEHAYGLEFRLDSIYTRGLDVAFGGVVRTGPSDHWPMFIDVRL